MLNLSRNYWCIDFDLFIFLVILNNAKCEFKVFPCLKKKKKKEKKKKRKKIRSQRELEPRSHSSLIRVINPNTIWRLVVNVSLILNIIKGNWNDPQLTTQHTDNDLDNNRLPCNGGTHSNYFELHDQKIIKLEIYFTAFLTFLRINFMFGA